MLNGGVYCHRLCTTIVRQGVGGYYEVNNVCTVYARQGVGGYEGQ